MSRLKDLVRQKLESAGRAVAQAIPNQDNFESPYITGGLADKNKNIFDPAIQTGKNLVYNAQTGTHGKDASLGDIGAVAAPQIGLSAGAGQMIGSAIETVPSLLSGNEAGALNAVESKGSDFGKIIKVGQAEQKLGNVVNTDIRNIEHVKSEAQLLKNQIQQLAQKAGLEDPNGVIDQAVLHGSEEAVSALKKSGIPGRTIQKLQENMGVLQKNVLKGKAKRALLGE